LGIDYSKLRAVNTRDIVGALDRDGFELRRQRGSHRRYGHADGRRLTLPYHSSGGTLVPKTLRSIVEDQARWDSDDLRQLGLI
jgi:predicted RNA binding protein YcfA (HicA-like mRNA interferase family)